MGQIKNLLTLLYSVILSVFLYYLLYFASLRIKINFNESLFLIALVIVIIGIVVLIARNQRFANQGRIRQKAAYPEEDSDSTKTEDESSGPFILSGFNSITIILTGVFLLIVDVIIK